MAHPDYIVAPEARGDLPMLEPVYPLTAGLSGKILLKIVAAGASSGCRSCPNGRSRTGWRSAAGRLRRRRSGACTGPVDPADVSAGGPAWQRLAYDELLAGQLALALVRQSLKSAARPQRRPATAASARGCWRRCRSR